MGVRILMFSSQSFEQQAFTKALQNPPRGIEDSARVSITYTEAALNETTAQMAQGFPVICIFVTDKVQAATLQILKNQGVQLIALRCAGFNNVDIVAAEKLAIKVVRVPAYSPEAVAEFAVGIYLTLNRKIHRASQRVHEGNFSLAGLVGHNVHGQTIGVVGTGNIGRCVAQIYRGFGAQVLAYDLNPDTAWAGQNKVHYCDLPQLLQKSDVVTLHVPLNASTKHLMNRERFAQMKPQAYFINTSRGGLIDSKELIRVLKNRSLAGAALDVYEEEEGVFFKDHSDDIIDDDILARLTTFPNVLITSHQAFLTEEALQQIAQTTLKNIFQWQQGEVLTNQVKSTGKV
ncbi:MAG: 2-hydroxyacid dehydrogenase [Pseudobdellovibrionaceae bacterium]